jgi:hypothetical protein
MLRPFQLKEGQSELLISLQTDDVKGQSRKRRRLDSSSILHREHQIGPMKDCFCRFSQVGALIFKRIHMNNFYFGGNLNF